MCSIVGRFQLKSFEIQVEVQLQNNAYCQSSAKMLAMHQIFQSSHQGPVCLVKHAVFPQIVLSGVGIAAARGR